MDHPRVTAEFALIARHFARPAQQALLGIGDDCALLPSMAGRATAISTDTLVAGVHFFADVEPISLGHKALAVNLSDLAAMGATPRFFTLALTLPAIDDDWLAQFAAGMFALATQQDIELVGGDTTRGPLSITITVLGEVDAKAALRRDAAQAGDDIWVSGSLGGSALALDQLGKGVDRASVDATLLERLERPQPRVALGQALFGIAHAAIDVSDGLLADLQHIADRSQLSAALRWDDVPCHPLLGAQPAALQQRCALTGGDDYELCFTAPVSRRDELATLSQRLALPLTRIGHFGEGDAAVRVHDANGVLISTSAAGFDHFSGTST